MLGAAIVAIAVHRAILWQHGILWLFLLVRTDTRMDTILVGALLASLWVRGKTPTRGLVPAAWLSTVLPACCFVFTRDDAPWLYLGGFTMIAVAAAIIVLATVDGRWSGNRLLELAPLQLVGRVSYGLYLWHLAVFTAVARYTTHEPNPLRILVGFGLTIAGTTFSYLVVERPTMKWRRALRAKAVA
jgi:peptidoglycan/LPS O-acetylase OafA/YrhL